MTDLAARFAAAPIQVIRMTETVGQTVKTYRAADAKLRRMERNVRLAMYQGRNSFATERQMRALAEQLLGIETELVANGHHKLAGHLHAEADLARRVSEARDAGQRRPELRSRLNRTRAMIRRRVEEG